MPLPGKISFLCSMTSHTPIPMMTIFFSPNCSPVSMHFFVSATWFGLTLPPYGLTASCHCVTLLNGSLIHIASGSHLPKLTVYSRETVSSFMVTALPIHILPSYLTSTPATPFFLTVLSCESVLTVLQRLCHYFPSNTAGQSLRTGGATDLASRGFSSDAIMMRGCWISNDWRKYVRQHPTLLHTLFFLSPSMST